MKLRQGRQAILRILFCFGVSFFSLSFAPLALREEGTAGRLFALILGILFWAFLILGFLAVSRANRCFYAARRSLAAEGKRVRQKFPGILSFSREPSHLALYGLILCGLALLLADAFRVIQFGNWMFPIISVTLFAIALHSVVDGRNYKTLQLLQERREDGHEKDA